MARPIQDTPVLTGEDARRFVELMNTPRPETPERKAQIQRAYETVMKMMSRNRKNVRALTQVHLAGATNNNIGYSLYNS